MTVEPGLPPDRELFGRVTWVGPRRIKVVVGVFSCRHCRTEISEPQPEATSELRRPGRCYPEQGGCGVPGFVEGFDFMELHSHVEAQQRIRVTEEGSARRWTVVLRANLIGAASRGARVTIRGHVVPQDSPEGEDSRASETPLVARSVSVARSLRSRGTSSASDGPADPKDGAPPAH